MKRRYYVLLVAFTSVVALMSIFAAVSITAVVDKDSRDALIDEAAVTVMEFSLIETDYYIYNNVTYYPNEGYHYVIVYTDVIKVGSDEVVLSAGDFKLIEDGRSHPLAHYAGFSDGARLSSDHLSYYHYKLCYEVDDDFVLTDADMTYSGRYWVELEPAKEDPNK